MNHFARKCTCESAQVLANVAFETTKNFEREEWVMDSGASPRMCKSREAFSECTAVLTVAVFWVLRAVKCLHSSVVVRCLCLWNSHSLDWRMRSIFNTWTRNCFCWLLWYTDHEQWEVRHKPRWLLTIREEYYIHEHGSIMPFKTTLTLSIDA